MTPFAKWLIDKFGSLLIDKIFAALGSWIGAARRDEANVEKGRAEANASTLQQLAERIAVARAAEAEAEKAYQSNPDDDSGFDPEFRRD